MPVLFGLFGIILIVAGVRDRVTNGNPSLMSLLKDDFTGQSPFWKWILAILFIGAVGYIPNLRPISRGFMALVIIVFFLSNKGVFTQLENTFKGTSTNASNSSAGKTSSNNNTIGDYANATDSELQLANALSQIGVK